MATNRMKVVNSYGDAILILSLVFHLERLLFLCNKDLGDPKLELKVRELVL